MRLGVGDVPEQLAAAPGAPQIVDATAGWQDRTGEGQDVTVDLREAVYNVNPIITPVMQQRVAAGALPPNDPVVARMTFTPSAVTWGPSSRWA